MERAKNIESLSNSIGRIREHDKTDDLEITTYFIKSFIKE